MVGENDNTHSLSCSNNIDPKLPWFIKVLLIVRSGGLLLFVRDRKDSVYLSS